MDHLEYDATLICTHLLRQGYLIKKNFLYGEPSGKLCAPNELKYRHFILNTHS